MVRFDCLNSKCDIYEASWKCKILTFIATLHEDPSTFVELLTFIVISIICQKWHFNQGRLAWEICGVIKTLISVNIS